MQYNLETDTVTFEAYKVDIEIAFQSDEPWLVTLNNDTEYDPLDDTLYGLFVSTGHFPNNKIKSLADILTAARLAYEDLRTEAEQEDLDGSLMQQELSSPEATGRV